jgi:hypothetical protein
MGSVTKIFAVQIALLLCFSCQRPIDPYPGALSKGSLSRDIDGNCKPIIVGGRYAVGQEMTDTNYVQAEVSVMFPGKYTITTDTVNGYFFNATGTFSNEGNFEIKLRAFGKPAVADTDHFIIKYNSSVCEMLILVSDKAKGQASFSFNGATDICTNDSVYGNFVKGIILDTSSKVKIRLNVMTPGRYSITTNAINGYSFSSSGEFSSTGTQTIFLSASGKPENAGTDVFTITAAGSSCNFSVNVLSPVIVANDDYYPLSGNSYWTYDDLVHPGDTIKRTIADTIILDSNIYKVMTEEVKFGGPYQYYIRKNGTNYLEYAAPNKFTTFFQYKNPVYADIPFLKENLASNAKWSSPEYVDTASDGNVFTIRYDFTCTNADATTTLSGKAFTNIFEITMLPLVKLSGQSFNYTGEQYLFYYAKGVGLIYMKKTLSGFIQTEWRIRNWRVN